MLIHVGKSDLRPSSLMVKEMAGTTDNQVLEIGHFPLLFNQALNENATSARLLFKVTHVLTFPWW